MQTNELDLTAFIRDVPGYPKPGIVFKDITPLWKDKEAFKQMVDSIAANYQDQQIDTVAAVESR